VVGEQPIPASLLQQTQQAGRAAKPGEKAAPPSLGLAVQDVPAELKPLLGDVKGGALVVGVDPGSRAFDAGLEPGDVILKANESPVQGASDFQRFSKRNAAKERPIVLYVQRGPEERLYVGISGPSDS
jgi:serine protease Do